MHPPHAHACISHTCRSLPAVTTAHQGTHALPVHTPSLGLQIPQHDFYSGTDFPPKDGQSPDNPGPTEAAAGAVATARITVPHSPTAHTAVLPAQFPTRVLRPVTNPALAPSPWPCSCIQSPQGTDGLLSRLGLGGLLVGGQEEVAIHGGGDGAQGTHGAWLEGQELQQASG